MAKISATTNESIYQIKRWLGVNEAAEGEARLKTGEAAEMRNFQITAGGALRKRPGSKNVAGLAAEYVPVVTTTKRRITQVGVPTLSYQMYPRAVCDSVGNVIVDGSAVEVTEENAAQYKDYYTEIDGKVHSFAEMTYTPPTPTGNESDPGRGFRGNSYEYSMGFMLVFSAPPVFENGQWDLSNAKVQGFHDWGNNPKYAIVQPGGEVQCIFAPQSSPPKKTDFGLNSEGLYASVEITDGYFELDYWRVAVAWKEYISQKYLWNFYPMDSRANATDKEVRGLWSGFVNKREVICTACSGYLWELSNNDGVWSKVPCGQLDTSKDVFMFGFSDKLYLLNGSEYKVWNGTLLEDVVGYVPLVAISIPPAGGGTTLEQINKLTPARRCWISPDGTAKEFKLPEEKLASVDYVKNTATGESITGWSGNIQTGHITFQSAPAAGTNTIEVGYSAAQNFAPEVKAMRYAETYNGVQDTRVFLYGDGTNKAIYSGLDYDGEARADYFPDMNVCHVGDANTPLTGMIRQYSSLMAFKLDSAYSIRYDTITLADGSVTAGFYITPVNKIIGNCALGQVQLVENRPRTLDGRSVVEWKATSTSGSITNDQRNTERISQRVDTTIREFTLETAKTYYDKFTHEYYVIGQNGITLVHNIDADVWYTYTDFDALCLINYQDELYFGTADGYLRHASHQYFSDNDRPIDAYWESGSMPFDRDYMRKYSATIWIGIKPEESGYLCISSETDKKSDFAEYTVATAETQGVPRMHRIKLKAKKFTYYKLILFNNTADTTATVVSADIRVRATGYVR